MELLLSMLTLAVVVLAVGHLFFYSWTGWVVNSRSVAMQRDAYLAMEQIAREIRNSNIDEVSGDSSGIYFVVDGTRSSAIDILAADIPASPNVNISGFTVRENDDSVRVAFTLYTDDYTDQNDYEITVKTRNEVP